MKSIILLAAMTVMLASCGCEPKPTVPKGPVTFPLNSYVYVHGEVKGFIDDTDYGDQYPRKYKVTICGNDGSYHVWSVLNEELSKTRDTTISRVITDKDSSSLIIYKTILDQQEISNSILETDRQIKRQLEDRAKTNNGL